MSRAAPVSCWHCGDPVPPGTRIEATVAGTPRPMCCHGCRAVATLIDQAGLDRYYDFRDALPDRPQTADAREDDFTAWDRPAALEHYARAEGDGRYRITLVLENVHCAACAWLIRRFVGDLDGVAEIRVDIADGRAHLTWNPERTPLARIASRLAALGYLPHLDTPTAGADRNRIERRAMLKYLAVAGLGMMQVMSYALAGYVGAWQGIDHDTERFFQLISMIVAVPVALYAGQPFYTSAWRTLKHRRMGMDVPVAAAMLLALFSSIVITLLDAGEAYFDSVVMFIFFLLLGRYAVMVARQQAGQIHSALARSLPARAVRLTGSGSETVALIELERGDRVQVTAGETLPADGLIESGAAMVDESLLSGESVPRRRIVGERVLTGSLVRDGQVTIRVENLGQDTVLSGIVRLLERARSLKPRAARLADRLAGVFVALVLAGAAVAGLAWWHIDPASALPVMISVLVVSCPCALALGTPVALAAAARGFASRGILIASPDALEDLPGVSHVVLDKTGTLTDPKMRIGEVELVGDDLSREEVLALAGRLERVSRHPVASAFAGHDDGAEVARAEVVTACGVTGRIDGADYRLGKPQWAGSAEPAAEQTPGQWIVLARGDRALARFRVDSPLRDGAAALVGQLIGRGLEVILASGDNRANVARIAAELGIERFEADMQPADKLELVRRLQAEGARVAMIGDGINDAPVLAGADVSLALADGADIARTQADLIVTGSGLQRAAAVFELAPRVRHVIGQNLAWALAYNLTAMPLAAAGFIPPWAAAIGMSASSLLVVLNGRRAGHLPRSATPRQEAGPASSTPGSVAEA